VEIEDWSAEPERLEFDAERLRRAEGVLRRGLEAGVYPAAAYLVLRHGKIAAQGAMGVAQPHRDPPAAATLGTIFDMASLTKPVTATLLLQLVERGELHLGMKVADFLPEAAEAPCCPLTLLQLATHTSGLPAWKPLYQTERGSALAEILATELEAEPGTRYAYCDLGYILIGAIVERVSETTLDRLARDRIFEPLGMAHSGFCPDAASHKAIAATANCPWREGEILVGQVHDANAHSMQGVAGHAGLFSTAPDMARFAVSLFHPEEAAPIGLPRLLSPAARIGLPRLLSPAAARLATTRQIDRTVGGHSVGWFTVPNGMLPRGDLLSKRTIGHTGFTGTMVLHDPECGVTLLLLTNRVYAPEDGTGMGRIRRMFANAVAGALS
jgi:CubicO group peptidase (beta-lactamase class C family)